MLAIHTFGYGRTTQKEFMERCKEMMPFGSLFVDVRKENCRSRNGKWCCWGDKYIGSTLFEPDTEYLYRPAPAMANSHGHTQQGLAQYRFEIRRGCMKEHTWALARVVTDFAAAGGTIADGVIEYAEGAERHVCILCAEREPYTKSQRPACHRVHVACAMRDCLLMRDNWHESSPYQPGAGDDYLDIK